MKIKKLLFVLLVLYAAKGFSQGENNNWYFGDKAAINFATATPVSTYNSQMTQFEGVASISNASGELLFYTNGVNIWNREHSIMPNGSGLLGNDSTEQILILPHPGNANLYYLFTMAHVSSTDACHIVYSIIDMSLGATGTNGNPLGNVSSVKNVDLMDDSGLAFEFNSEAITCLPNSNNNGYWILIPNKGKLYSYKLDNTGFDIYPFTTSSLPSSLTITNEYAEIKVSPLLPSSLSLPYSNLVSISLWNNTSQSNDLRIRSFDNSTGALTTYYVANIATTNAYSTEFSSDGLILYAGLKQNNSSIIALDLFNNDPNTNSKTVTNLNLSYGAIQRGINNRIYVSVNGHDYLSEITNPNNFSTSAFTYNSIKLNDVLPSVRFCKLGLPQLIPILPRDECMANRMLSWIETNGNAVYTASNLLLTSNNYTVNNGQEVLLKAGGTIQLSSNTHIQNGSLFQAKIESCTPDSSKAFNAYSQGQFENTFTLKSEDLYLKMYPNPVSNGTLFIETAANAEKTIAVYDVLGKQVLNTTTSDSSINVSALHTGVYIVNITEDGKTASRKLVIK